MKVKVVGVALNAGTVFHGALTRKLLGRTLVERLIDKGDRFGVPRSDILIYTDVEEVALKAERQGINSLLQQSCNNVQDEQLRCVKKFIKNNTEDSDTVLWLSPYAPLVSINSLKRAQHCFDSSNVDVVFGATVDVDQRPVETPFSILEMFNAKPVVIREARSSSFAFIRANYVHGEYHDEHRQAAVPVGKDVFEIRSLHDWWVCEKLLTRKRIVFRVIGNEQVGMGHIYRALSLAHEIIDHEVIFTTVDGNQDVITQFEDLDYPLQVVKSEKIIRSIIDLEPHLVINDILNTSAEDVVELREEGIKVVNFEDLGQGAALSDLTINELYDHPQFEGNNILWGRNYFFVRDEFEDANPCSFRGTPGRVLLVFGGVDGYDLTRKMLRAIESICLEFNLMISIVTGPGYREYSSLEKEIISKPNVSLTHATGVISKIMEGVSVAITSNGRTVYEMAHMNIPAIVVPQHSREKTHEFAAEENGFVPLNPYKEGITEKEVAKEFRRLIEDHNHRKRLFLATLPHRFTDNKKKVVDLILAGLEERTISNSY